MDLYVVGYTDNVMYEDPKNKKRKDYRSSFFVDTPNAAIKSLFVKTNIERTTKFSSTYGSLEKVSKEKRVNLSLKLKLLKETILDVYGKQDPEPKKEAKFVLVAVQIVSEAARFKFMEEAIVYVRTASTKAFRDKMVEFQNNWNSISKSIHDSTPPCTKLKPQQTINNKKYTTLDDIKNDMAILKFKRSK
ncbi:ribosome-inactivating protein PD-L1/PD-L2-like [Chenopodium quinoa]|uniref:ribosome-inactivating protein PD-L1/PD-L2-like n=1 Tax=Chenopodium quinoa TaxID=63459 RepID=UPI000B7971D1|nr:ribosome-inactivating protein PD-L1/PD-L2-like [Chenopodium quinoa]